jgi:hypothetical protein
MRGFSSVKFDAQQDGEVLHGIAVCVTHGHMSPIGMSAPIDPAIGIDGYAESVKCPRHISRMRACRWDHDKPCECRLAVAAASLPPTPTI